MCFCRSGNYLFPFLLESRRLVNMFAAKGKEALRHFYGL